MNSSQKGYTLVELMIAIVFGMLVIAAALSIYLSGQRFLSLQNGMSELQQNALFGLSIFTHDLRHANLNTDSSQVINDKTLGSGIVFSTDNLPTSLSGVSTSFFSKQDIAAFGTNESSDQLLIQFVPQYDSSTTVDTDDTGEELETSTTTNSSTMKTCEGEDTDYDGTETRVYVQRYYLAEILRNGESYSPQKYALYCDAGYYTSSSSSIEGLGSDAQQLMQNVDAFKVKLGVKSPDDTFQYMSINDYLSKNASITSSDEYYQVVSIEVGVLAKSTNPVGANADIDNSKTFNVFGGETGNYGDVTLKTDQQVDNKYLRQVFSQVVALRNTLGAE